MFSSKLNPLKLVNPDKKYSASWIKISPNKRITAELIFDVGLSLMIGQAFGLFPLIYVKNVTPKNFKLFCCVFARFLLDIFFANAMNLESPPRTRLFEYIPTPLPKKT